MLTANVEATQRLPLPAASHRDQAAGDVFADLLRQLGDSAKPAASRPEKPERPQAREADEPRPERIADEDEAAEPLPAAADPADAGRAPVAGEDHDPGKADARASAADQAGDAVALPAETVAPDAPAGDNAIQVIELAAAPAAAAPAPSGMESVAPPVPGTGPVVSATAGPAAPAQPAAPAPTLAPAPAAPAAAAPLPAPAAATTEMTTPAATPIAAATTPTVPAPAGTQPTVATVAQPTVATVTPMPVAADRAAPAPVAPETADMIAAADIAAPAGNDDAGVVIRADRGPTPPPAPGLGKLGTGAEAALAAQAAGDRPQGIAPDRAGKTNPATPPALDAAARPGQNGNAATPQAAATVAATPAPTGLTSAAATTSATASVLQSELAPSTAGKAADETLDGIGSVSALGLRSTGGAQAAQAAGVPRAVGLPSPAEQVAVQIQRAVSDGTSRITVQLKPAALGSIEIQLDFAQDGRVSASIRADRPDTLDLLQRDARLLERSLQDAGLKADSGSLSFDLRDGGRNGAGSHQTAGGNRHDDPVPNRHDNQASAESAQPRPARTGASDRGVDIRV